MYLFVPCMNQLSISVVIIVLNIFKGRSVNSGELLFYAVAPLSYVLAFHTYPVNTVALLLLFMLVTLFFALS